MALVFLFTYYVLHIHGHWQIVLGLFFRLVSDWLDSMEGLSLLHNFMYFYVFSAVGYTLSEQILRRNALNRLTEWGWLLPLGLLFITGQSYWFMNREDIHTLLHMAIAFIGIVFTMQLCYVLSKYDWLPVLRFIGYHSLYIYLIHVFIISGTRIALTAVGMHHVGFILLTGFVLGIGLPILFFHVVLRMGGWLLFSLTRKELETYPVC